MEPLISTPFHLIKSLVMADSITTFPKLPPSVIADPPHSFSQYLQELDLSPEQKELIASLPVDESVGVQKCHQYQGFWYYTRYLVGILSCQDHFQASSTDIILVSYPKTGCTWLKALVFAVTKRTQFPDLKHHPLLSTNPHELVPFMEFSYMGTKSPDFDSSGHPRVIASHLPTNALPKSVIDSGCKIVYLCRNPKDTFISLWHFINKINPQEKDKISLDEAVTKFTTGISSFGPYWEHVLSYWNESQENPNRVLFLMYEEMKENPELSVKKLSEFLGCPFSSEEEAGGMVKEIVKLCSFDNLRNLEVNKNGKRPAGISNDSFFRRGEVGDSANYLSPQNAKLIDDTTEEKFRGSGLIM